MSLLQLALVLTAWEDLATVEFGFDDVLNSPALADSNRTNNTRMDAAAAAAE